LRKAVLAGGLAALAAPAIGSVLALGSAAAPHAIGVVTPTERIGVGSNGPCVITSGDQVTLTPSLSVTFGRGSGVYQQCPS